MERRLSGRRSTLTQVIYICPRDDATWAERGSSQDTVEPTITGERVSGRTTTRLRKRGFERRTAILEATLRILGRDGASAVTHRTVAAEAGVPVAATTYYFDSKEHLIAEAFRLFAEKDAKRVAALAGRMDRDLTRGQLANRLADFLYYDLHPDRIGLIAQFEFLLQAARRPELEPYARVFYDTIEAELERTLRRIGSPSPAIDTRLVLAAVAGIEVDSLSTPSRPLGRVRLRRLTNRLLDALLGSPADSSAPLPAAALHRRARPVRIASWTTTPSSPSRPPGSPSPG